MRKILFYFCVIATFLLLILGGCAAKQANQTSQANQANQAPEAPPRSHSQAPQPPARARHSHSHAPRHTTPYTIMVYMNGSDLESEFGAATDDLAEMLDSGLDSRNANVIVFTGGAHRWHNNAIPAECVIWQLKDGSLYELENIGTKNMGNPNTLRDFIQYGTRFFPAEKYGLIMWDHGGGAISGFGHDEKFGDSSLTLLDLKKAFEEAGLAQNKLEFLGFDACLMATVEMAILANDYAKVLIAAEDLEPGEGWNYDFLAVFNENPQIGGLELGKIIVDYFMDFYESIELEDDDVLTLSVIQPAHAARVMEAMGELMSLDFGDRVTFNKMARRRANTKTFGEGSPRDNCADMVDIGDMAAQLADLYPRQAAAVLAALGDCVYYSRHNSDVDIYGLSTFYIYGGKSEGVPSLRTYSDLEMSQPYTQFLHRFFKNLLISDDTVNLHTELVLWQPVGDTFRLMSLLELPAEEMLFPQINGQFVTLFHVHSTAKADLYAIPVFVNGNDADIIVSFSQNEPDGKIKGFRHNSASVFQKGYDPISIGDEISLYRLETDYEQKAAKWVKTEPLTVTFPLVLEWEAAPEGFRKGFRHTSVCNEVTYTVI
ncbi:MAG: clostripain-related cysteine peptidase [Defluviitaleaceae bacterium]|nr:clostripain-related cysteine peptidase [Defluviitaleaceae bacterium]